MRLAEFQHFVGEQCEVGGDNKLQVALLFPVLLKCQLDDEFDERKIEKWLAALELDLESRRRRAEHEFKRLRRRLSVHVEG